MTSLIKINQIKTSNKNIKHEVFIIKNGKIIIKNISKPEAILLNCLIENSNNVVF